jgi:membrane-associated phospholipid phosphatase
MLLEVVARVAAFLVVALPVALVVLVGRAPIERTRREWRSRVRSVAPLGVVLAVALLLNRWVRQSAPAFSREYGLHLTSTFYRLEGEFILVFQSVASTEATSYFSFVYVYGYAFLLVFPVLAYFTHAETDLFRRLLTAYTFNYAVGVVLYVLVVAYGPRNLIVDGLETVLYDTRPEYQYLTREVNRNTNVFPSLHTSLSATVAAFAAETRDVYPAWFPLALLLSTSVVVSTMYLGIHWGIDVLAGLVLAAASVAVSRLVVGDRSIRTWLAGLRRSLRET